MIRTAGINAAEPVDEPTPVRVILLDTTLRDGGQSPGFDLARSDKIAVALSLERLGVDIVEAGFPASSPGQFDDARAVADVLNRSAVSVMARANPDDIRKAGIAVGGARVKYIHTSISTSPLHRRFKLKKSRSVILDMAVDAVSCALQYADFVEIGAEDATRTEPEFLHEFCTMVTDAGASVVNIADTTGYIQPQEFYAMIRSLYLNVNAFREGRARLSVHCHNDLGLATANALAGLSAGALQAEVTLSGAGERSGNTPLEELVMALKLRGDHYCGLYTGIDLSCLDDAVRKLSAATGIPVSPVKPVIGRNAMRHTSGIHQKGMIASEQTYSIIPSSMFGARKHEIRLSRHSGAGGINHEARALSGIGHLTIDDISVIERFKALADARTELSSTDVLQFLNDEKIIESQIWRIETMRYSFNRHGGSSVSIKGTISSSDGIKRRVSAKGAGRWETVVRMLLGMFSLEISVAEYSITAAGDDINCRERCCISLIFEGETYSGETSGFDSVYLMAECYIGIINRIIAKLQLTLR